MKHGLAWWERENLYGKARRQGENWGSTFSTVTCSARLCCAVLCIKSIHPGFPIMVLPRSSLPKGNDKMGCQMEQGIRAQDDIHQNALTCMHVKTQRRIRTNLLRFMTALPRPPRWRLQPVLPSCLHAYFLGFTRSIHLPLSFRFAVAIAKAMLTLASLFLISSLTETYSHGGRSCHHLRP